MPNNVDTSNNNLLHHAVEAKAKSWILRLIYCGAKLDQVNHNQKTPLQLAIRIKLDPNLIMTMQRRSGIKVEDPRMKDSDVIETRRIIISKTPLPKLLELQNDFIKISSQLDNLTIKFADPKTGYQEWLNTNTELNYYEVLKSNITEINQRISKLISGAQTPEVETEILIHRSDNNNTTGKSDRSKLEEENRKREALEKENHGNVLRLNEERQRLIESSCDEDYEKLKQSYQQVRSYLVDFRYNVPSVNFTTTHFEQLKSTFDSCLKVFEEKYGSNLDKIPTELVRREITDELGKMKANMVEMTNTVEKMREEEIEQQYKNLEQAYLAIPRHCQDIQEILTKNSQELTALNFIRNKHKTLTLIKKNLNELRILFEKTYGPFLGQKANEINKMKIDMLRFSDELRKLETHISNLGNELNREVVNNGITTQYRNFQTSSNQERQQVIQRQHAEEAQRQKNKIPVFEYEA